jgi:hypothetical protein
MKTIIKTLSQVTLATGLILFAAGCKKAELDENRSFQANSKTVSAEEQRTAMELLERVPTIGFWDVENGNLYKFNTQTRDFNFSQPSDGWDFSNSEDVQYVTDNNGGLLIIPVFSFGGNTGGGTIVAGNSALNVDYTFCFSASEEALGLDLFDFGGDFNGISGVIGIAGDFEALADGDVDEDADFTDFFQGFAAYMVYDDEASGSYNVLNWLEDLEDEDVDNDEAAFAYVIDFVEPGIYFSADGQLSVSGGTINFDGEYLAITDFLLDFDDEEGDLAFDYVSGFGALGCN